MSDKTKAPAATGCADVIVVSGSFNVERLSQLAANAVVQANIMSSAGRVNRWIFNLETPVYGFRPEQYSGCRYYRLVRQRLKL
jgi:hypothetical protein